MKNGKKVQFEKISLGISESLRSQIVNLSTLDIQIKQVMEL